MINLGRRRAITAGHAEPATPIRNGRAGPGRRSHGVAWRIAALLAIYLIASLSFIAILH